MPADTEDPRLDEIAVLGTRLADVRREVARAIHGQVDVVDQTLICLLAGGHVLLVGVPGLGKSRLVETLSVVIQVASFKLTGKRVFRMAPLHHHYELKGWKETQVVVRFWIITMMLVLVGLSRLKLL